MRARTRPARIQRTGQSSNPPKARPRPPEARVAPRADPRAFLRRLRSWIGGAAVVTFGAFLGLTSLNVVGVTAHNPTSGAQATPSSPASAAQSLPQGDFFGPTGDSVPGILPPGARAGQPVLQAGGDLPLLSSGGS